MKRKLPAILALFVISLPAAAAQVVVSDAWVRATMPGQKTSGAYLHIRADSDAKLVGVTSPAAPRAEIHEMKMDGDVMRMRELKALDLPRGKTVALEPGGYHIMLLKLKTPIAAGDAVPLKLVVESGGRRQTIEVKAEARSMTGDTSHHHH